MPPVLASTAGCERPVRSSRVNEAWLTFVETAKMNAVHATRASIGFFVSGLLADGLCAEVCILSSQSATAQQAEQKNP